MSSNTPNLGLLKKDPMVDGNETFNIETMLNDNWDKIDEAVGQVREDLGNVNIPDASLTTKGKVQLSNATDSTAENVAATPKAVKEAYDRGSAGVTAAAAAQSKADAAETPAGAQAKANAAETNAKTYAENYTKQNSALVGWNSVNGGVRTAFNISSQNLNSIVNTGFYDGLQMSNAPKGETGWFFVQVISHSNNPGQWTTQIAYDFNAAHRTFRRTQTNGAWSAWTQIGNASVSDDPNHITYHVPSQYPTVAAAVEAIPKFNAGPRTISIAPDHYDTSEPELTGFAGGVISIKGQTNAQYPDGPTFSRPIRIVNNNCRFTLAVFRLEGSARLEVQDNGNYTYMFDIVKVGGGQGIIVAGGFASIVFGVFVGCSTAVTATNGASVVCRGNAGNNNTVGYSTSEATMYVSYNSMSATTLKYTDSGGRIFEGAQPAGT
ncbi:pyocin knob domain-containing protein [Paenibacillus sp. DMB20]|uniref:pyocin knob domain-containing protein n=1 Tax=Paenibacillus sp. DMB20 TaxID=1642570 RepID=UPI000627C795|nr:pyocin knob domain-containing protein [Paenibacillus sp. DMB20]KKO50988.1 hypothetical protein XI25_28625 [Paenibacillus sp. DMB20]